MTKKLIITLILVFALAVVVSSLSLAVPYNFGGETVVIQHNMTFDRMYGDNPEGLAHLDWIEREFNVNLEWTVGGRDERVVEPLVAAVMAGDAPDLIRMQSRAMSLAASENLLMPFPENIVKRDMPDFIKNILDSITFAGQYYTFAPVWQNPGPGKGIYFNKEIFEQEGLPNPYELYESGEWTFDAFREIVVKATRDTTGDGVIDQFGWGEAGHGDGPAVNQNVVDFLVANNVNIFEFKDGNAIFTLDTAEAIAVYEFLQDLMYTQDLFPWQRTLNENLGGVNRRQYFMEYGKIAMMASTHFHGQLKFEYGRVSFPRGPHADEHVAVVDHTNAWSISITSRHDPEALMELTYAIKRYTANYGDDFETQLADYIDSRAMNYLDWESVESFQWGLENVKVFVQEDRVYSPWFVELNQSILRDGESPAAAIDAIKVMAQSYLDDLFDQ